MFSLPCLNVIHHHSLFILPPSSLHAKANLILGLLIVGAFSQAFFQFASILSSRRAWRKTSSNNVGEGIPVARVLIRDCLTSRPPPHPPPAFTPPQPPPPLTSSPLFFSSLFLMSCSFPVKWIITVGIILVTWHYLDEVNN